MELRPRKGRSAQTPSSTPTPAKPSSRKPSNPSSRKKPTSLPPPPLVLFASADKGLHPKQIHVDLRCPSPAPNQTNHDNSLSAETPLSDFVKSRRKAVSLTAKKKNKALNNTFTEAGSDAEQDTTSMDEACTANDRNAIALEAVQLDDTATCDEIAAVKDSKGAEGTGDKTSIELVGEKLVRKDKKLQSAKKKSPTERRVEKTENGGLLGEVGKFKLDHVNDQDHSLVAAAPGMAASDECHHPLLLILSDDENAEVSGVMQTHVCEGKQGQDLKSSGKKKSRSSKENFNEENIIRNLFEENNAVVLSPSDREPAEHLEHGTCNVANPSNDDDTEMDNGNTPEDTEIVNSTYESQCCKPCTEILKESLQSDTVMLVIDEANGLTPDEAVEGDEFGNEVNCNTVPEYSSQKSDAAEGGEDFGNEHAHSNVPEESSHRESKRDEELSNEHDDFPELKLNEAKGGSVHNSDDSNIDDDSGDSSGSDEEGDLASIFASSMKAHLHISEPSVLSKSKGMQSELNVRKGRESSITKDVAKGSHVNGSRSVGSELSWLPKVALSTSKNHRPQAGLLETKPNDIWEKDRGLQDGLCLPPVDPVKLNKLAKKLRKDTAGHQWYNLSAPTITPELKKELQLVKLRGVLDPKRHYKAEDSKGLPKYFQVGTVVGGPADFYSGRLTKKEQKGSLANELLSDSSLSTYRKRKYLEIQDKKQAGGKGFLKKTKSKRTPAWAKI